MKQTPIKVSLMYSPDFEDSPNKSEDMKSYLDNMNFKEHFVNEISKVLMEGDFLKEHCNLTLETNYNNVFWSANKINLELLIIKQ